MMNHRLLTISVALISVVANPAWAQQGDGTDVHFPVSIFKPDKISPTRERIAAIHAPEGFKVEPFATGLGNPRIIAVAADGTIYVSRREQGDVIMLKDTDEDGKADQLPVVVANRAGAHGLAIKGDKLYLATVKEVFVADILPDGTLNPMQMLIGDLPDAGQHPNRTLAFGPDSMLYISVGSTCNACNESNPENATILRASPDGKSRTIFAAGLRNTIGFDWDLSTGELWGMDHGIDFLGDEVQPEELNKLELGKQYGWPHIWGADGVNPQSTPVGEITKQQWQAFSTPMTLGYKAHAAPMQMVFHDGHGFPVEYEGDAFVTMRGSWNRNPASGYEIVRIDFKDGKPQSFQPFVSGFLTDDGQTHIARPVGLAEAKDGSLLMSDDANGVLYRISYAGHAAVGSSSMAVPDEAMSRQAVKGTDVPLIDQRPQTAAPATIKVSSDTISPDGPMPAKHSEYFEGVSPSLSWSPVKGASSYMIVLEDPDAKPITPFVHWVAWNIPGNVTNLSEGLQEQPRLVEPKGVLQGRTSRGSVGYYGPRPPVGDPAHHYHIQVLALDSKLEVLPGSDRDTVLAAAAGHIIAKGELIGLYQQNITPLK